MLESLAWEERKKLVETNLVHAIAVFLSEGFKNFKLPREADEDEIKEGNENWQDWPLRDVKVVEGFLPPKRSSDEDDFPCVVVRADGGSSGFGAQQTKVSLIVCVYSKDDTACHGWQEAMDLKTHIQTLLQSMPDATLERKYQLRGEISWSMSSEQLLPFWQLDMETTWVMPGAVPFPNEVERFYR